MTSTLSKLVHILKGMILPWVTGKLALVSKAEAALLRTNAEAIDVVHYRPSIDGDARMTRHKDVKAKDSQSHSLISRTRSNCLAIMRNTANSSGTCSANCSLCRTATSKNLVLWSIAFSSRVRKLGQNTLYATDRDHKSEILKVRRLTKCFHRDLSSQHKYNGCTIKLCAKKAWIAPHLHKIPETKCLNQSWMLFHTFYE